jgi:Carboxypeptidase regulatory-like domain/Lamin Tail Domain
MSRYLRALFILSLLVAAARGQTGPQVTQSAVAGGGVSTVATLRLEGTIGQGVAASGSGGSSGGVYTLDSGFLIVTAPVYVISGRVTLAAGGAPLANVTVTLTKPDSTPAVTTTDAGGNYSFAGLGSGGYTVTPSKINYGFTPSGQPVMLGTADQSGVNFTAASTAAASAVGGALLVTEFRLQGPAPASPAVGNANGELDEFVELYNNTDAALDISGFKIDTSPGFTITIPANTTLPARGHYLIANGGGYSLSSYAAPDQTYAGFDLPTRGSPCSTRPAASLTRSGSLPPLRLTEKARGCKPSPKAPSTASSARSATSSAASGAARLGTLWTRTTTPRTFSSRTRRGRSSRAATSASARRGRRA